MTYFNSEFAVSQLNGNKELLCRLLTKFNTDYANAPQDMQKKCANSQFDSASLLVHTIKGVAGNLGMLHLYEHAKMLEPKCKEGQAALSEIKEFGDTLTATIRATQHFIKTEVIPQEALPDDANNAQSLQSLESVLTKNQFIPADKLAQYMQNLTMSAAQKDDLLLAIQQLNYEAALTLLRSAVK
ncbi:MAG: Hpt domain-containing protein [Glaciecola sp.]|nr:Hpt domain-containing protein [Glaciecola sp.]